MTRFARAKGSKSSNERLPEDATSWAEMKQQMEAKKREAEYRKNQKLADESRMKNYKKFLEESQSKNNTWADFPTATITQNKTKKNSEDKSVTKKRKNEEVLTKQNDDMKKEGNNDKKKKKINETNSNPKKRKLDDKTEAKRNKNEKKLKKIEEVAVNELKNNINIISDIVIKKADNSEVEDKLKKQSKPKKTPTKLNSRNKEAVNDKILKSDDDSKKIKDKKNETKKKNKKNKKKKKPLSVFINGEEKEIVLFEGTTLQLLKEDADRLDSLRKEMRRKGLPNSEIKKAINLERRRAETFLKRAKKTVCFNCRQTGHSLAECPRTNTKDTIASGICFKCGSTEHTHFQCKVVKKDEYKFATCFICNEQGHITRQCPDNARGLYPKGGCCNVCGDVTHLKKDCPKYIEEQESSTINLDRIGNGDIEGLDGERKNISVKSNKRVQKVIKF